MKVLSLIHIALFQLILATGVYAQEMLGTALGNYAGVNSIQLNPSALHNSKSYLDIQLVGADLFLENNYLYMPKEDYRFSNFFKAGYEWPTHAEDYGTEERIFYHYTNNRRKNVFINERVNGPGAMLVWGKHAFALSTGFRTVSSFHNIPYEIANFTYLGLNYRTQHNINYQDNRPFSGATMSWAEIGLSYAYTIYARQYDRISAGITVKRLMGLGGFAAKVRQIDYTVIDDSTVSIKNLDADLGIALPVNYDNMEQNLDPLFKGGGFGFDVGVTYQRLARYHQEAYFSSLCAQPYEDYIYRIGIALIDIGGIRFKNNAVEMKIDNRSSYWDNLSNFQFRDISQLLDTLSYQFYGDTTSAYTGDKFTLWLPSALSVQFDYHLRKNIYINTSFIYGFNLSKYSLSRPAQLSVTPRFENRWFEANLPVSLYDWSKLRIGLSLRFYFLTIGTEKIAGFLHVSDFTGLDLYVALKFSLDKGSCRSKGPKGCGNGEYKKTGSKL